MNIPLALAFLFATGATLGWCLEFLFRNLISHKGPRGKYFINPGFCQGPYLPIYGIGLTLMFVISTIVTEKMAGKPGTLVTIAVVVVMMILMTLLELIGGSFLLDVLNMRLWDYRNQWGNYRGITCPLFTCIWGAIGAGYFLVLHPMVVGWMEWFSQNLAFSFCVGLFFGVFTLDLSYSAEKAAVIKEYGDSHDLVISYEILKEELQKRRKEQQEKFKFFNQASEEGSTRKALEEVAELAGEKKSELKKKVKKAKAKAKAKVEEAEAKLEAELKKEDK